MYVLLILPRVSSRESRIRDFKMQNGNYCNLLLFFLHIIHLACMHFDKNYTKLTCLFHEIFIHFLVNDQTSNFSILSNQTRTQTFIIDFEPNSNWTELKPNSNWIQTEFKPNSNQTLTKPNQTRTDFQPNLNKTWTRLPWLQLNSYRTQTELKLNSNQTYNFFRSSRFVCSLKNV